MRKAQNAHGVASSKSRSTGNAWRVVRPSRYARRITASTPMRVSGPAAGHALLLRPSRRPTLGTFNNCAGGLTPWGTYLTCEENFNGYFVNTGAMPPDQRRYGISARGRAATAGTSSTSASMRGQHPNEPNRFGWVVEIDPYDPQSRR